MTSRFPTAQRLAAAKTPGRRSPGEPPPGITTLPPSHTHRGSPITTPLVPPQPHHTVAQRHQRLTTTRQLSGRRVTGDGRSNVASKLWGGEGAWPTPCNAFMNVSSSAALACITMWDISIVLVMTYRGTAATQHTLWASVSDGPLPGARHPGIYRRRVRRRHQLYISAATHLTTCFLFMNCAAHRVVFSICHVLCVARVSSHFQDTSCQGRPKRIHETNTMFTVARVFYSRRPKDNPINIKQYKFIVAIITNNLLHCTLHNSHSHPV